VAIRNVKPTDAHALAQLARALGQSVEMSRLAQDIDAYAASFYVAESDDGISGYLIMRVERHPGCVQAQSPIQLWRLFVSPEHQGKGVAAGLVSRAFTYAQERAHDVVWLGTSEDNVRAIAFYRKSGFCPVGVAQLHQGEESHRDLIMSCAMS